MDPSVEHVVPDADLVRSLLAAQHPDLAELPLVEMQPGWDNSLWRLGDDLLVRLPRRALAAPLTAHEQRWLPELAPLLPLPIPVPVRVGAPTFGFPWPWSVVPWLEGSPGDRAAITQPDESAARLGGFLRALHRPAPAGAPHNPYRSIPLAERAAGFDGFVSRMEDGVDVAGARRVWEQSLAAKPWPGPPLWLHADLHPANTLFADGLLAAVLDFGDLCAGDPATDLAAAWLLLPASAQPVFLAAYGGVDDDTRRRSLGWAVLFALMLVSIGTDGRPTYGTAGRAALERVLASGQD